jgi:hypothetical protein
VLQYQFWIKSIQQVLWDLSVRIESVGMVSCGEFYPWNWLEIDGILCDLEGLDLFVSAVVFE